MESPASDMTRVNSPTAVTKELGEKLANRPASENGSEPITPPKAKKDLAFWMIMLSIAITMFLSALDLTAVSTALPAISRDLPGNFSWVGSSYALSSTVLLPVFGSLAQSFGRKLIMMSAIVIFMVGSILCAVAPEMWLMIFGRTVQGIGGGAILATSEIIVSDIVALQERGLFMGLLGLVWAISSAIGPIVGGAISEGYWRALFYMNIPIGAVSLFLVWKFMTLRVPEGSILSKLQRVDWIGSAFFVSSSTLIVFGLSAGGELFPWQSAGVLAPLIIGIAILPIFYYYEKHYAKNGILPFELFNRTTLLGYFTTCLHGIIVMAIVYFLPALYMSVYGRTPIQAGVSMLPVSLTVAPFAIIAGILVTITQNYYWINLAGWVLSTVGLGILSLGKPSMSHQASSALQIVGSIGLGLLYAATTFPVLSPLKISMNAHAMSFHALSRSFGQVLGITIGAATFNNMLGTKLPTVFLEALPHGASSAYSAIGSVKELPEPLRSAVRLAFNDSINTVWYVLIGFAGVGTIATLFIKSFPLSGVTDEAWGIERKSSTDTPATVV